MRSWTSSSSRKRASAGCAEARPALILERFHAPHSDISDDPRGVRFIVPRRVRALALRSVMQVLGGLLGGFAEWIPDRAPIKSHLDRLDLFVGAMLQIDKAIARLF